MQRSVLERSYHITAAAIAAKSGLQVTHGGHTAFCTPKRRINIPNLPIDSASAQVLGLGYVVHEVSHDDVTDFAVVQRAGTLEFVKRMFNIIEDHRIEGYAHTRWRGAFRSLFETREALHLEGRLGAARAGSSPAAIALNTALAYLNARLYNRAHSSMLETAGSESEEVFREQFPAIADAFFEKLHTADGLIDSEGALRLTREIFDLLVQNQSHTNGPDSHDDRPHGDSGDDDSDPSDDAGNGSAGDSNDDDSDPSDAAGNGSAGDSGDDESDPSDDAGNGSAGDSGDDDSDPSDAAGNGSAGDSGDDESDPSDAAGNGSAGDSGDDESDPSDDVGNGSAGGSGDDESDPWNNGAADLDSYDLGDIVSGIIEEQAATGEPFAPAEVRRANPGANGDCIHREARSGTSRLRIRLRQLMQSMNFERKRTRNKGRKIRSKHLYRAGVNDGRIFEKRSTSATPNTAVEILLDCSGSMTSRINIATQAAYAVHSALDEVPGIATQTSVFPMGNYCDDVGIVAPFDSTASRERRYFDQCARGTTPMDVAILRCGLDLVARPEPRRILLVITDGDPDDGSTATRALGLARDAGIEVYGIGIAIDVSPLFGEEHSMAIASVTDLATAMFHMLSRPLARIA